MGAAASSSLEEYAASADVRSELQQTQQHPHQGGELLQHQQEHQQFMRRGGGAAADPPLVPPTAARNSLSADGDTFAAAAETAAIPAATLSAGAAPAGSDGLMDRASMYAGPQKGMRSMGLDSLFQLPKLALAAAVWPDDASSSSGSLAAAKKVLQQREVRDPIPAVHACLSRYKTILLQNRLAALEKKDKRGEIEGGASRGETSFREGGGLHKESRGVPTAQCVIPPEDAFDCISLAGLTMMETGLLSDPSLGCLSRCVGTYKKLYRLRLQLEDKLQQTERRLRKAKNTRNSYSISKHRNIRKPHNGQQEVTQTDSNSSSSDSNRYSGAEGKNSKGASFEERSREGRRKPPLQHIEQQQQQKAHKRQQDDVKTACRGAVDCASAGVRRVAAADDGSSSVAAGCAGDPQELLQLQCTYMELREDIETLQRACGELHALLQQVWLTAKMPLEHKINKVEFRRLWCCAENNKQQHQLADNLFELCRREANRLENPTDNRNSRSSSNPSSSSSGSHSSSSGSNSSSNSTGSSSTSGNSSSSCRCGCGGGDSDRLTFTDLLHQLPPKALESMWCRAELRRKERQQFRYFWI